MDDGASDWRDRAEYAALYPVIGLLERPAAEALNDRVNEYCRYLAVLICQPDEYRLAAQDVDMAALATEHGFLVAFAEELVQHATLAPQLALPAVRRLRDILATEGLRRGHILLAGDKDDRSMSDDRAFAACVAMHLAGPVET